MSKHMKSKKGQVAGLSSAFYALMFASVALIVVVIVLAFGTEYTDNQQDDFGKDACAGNTAGTYTSYNATSKLCYNASGTAVVPGLSFNITGTGIESLDNLSEGTSDVSDVSIITIVLTLLIALIGVFAGVGYLKGKQ